jgi:hypothetical protein
LPFAVTAIIVRSRGWPADRRLDRAVGLDLAVHEREIFAAHGARLELADQVRLRGQRLRDDHQSGRVLVEPMDDPARGTPASRGSCASSPFSNVPPQLPLPGMDDHAGGLVDDDQRRVLEHDRQRHRLGDERVSGSGPHAEQHRLAPADLARCLGARAVDADAPIGQPCLQPAARISGKSCASERSSRHRRGPRARSPPGRRVVASKSNRKASDRPRRCEARGGVAVIAL